MNPLVYKIFRDHFKDDTSFTEPPLLGIFPIKYSQSEVRRIWKDAIKLGIEIGIREGSVEGQVDQMMRNSNNLNKLEFLKKLRVLQKEHNLAIHYNHAIGMCFVDTDMSNLITE